MIATKAARVAALAMASIGCSPSVTARGPGPRAPAVVEPAPSWKEYTLPSVGLSFLLPGSPEDQAGWTSDKQPIFYRAVGLELEKTVIFAAEYELDQRGSDEAVLAASHFLVKKIAHKSDIRMAGFRGEELEGESDHKSKRVRVFVVGRAVIVLAVEATTGAVDSALARRFFDSAKLALPWKVEPLPSLGLSIALPRVVVPISSKDPGVFTFALSGLDDDAFIVAAHPIATELQANPEAILDGVEAQYRKMGPVTLSVPFEVDGVSGRDVFVDVKDGHCRARVFAREDRLFQLMFTSKNRGRLSGPDAKRFFESLTWFD